ncbi:MAG: hypothetical protein IJS19_02950 [Muribaculaceae bacterium]|nr:hypothetical protein [Muribaculaceae bacterium]
MKDKIYLKLKQEYSSLGLGESILSAHAESLASTGFVTDENIGAVVKSQKTFLEGLQKSNDKRVAEAISKVKAEANKELEKQLADKQKELDEVKKLAEEKTVVETPAPKLEEKTEIPDWYKADKEARDKELAEIRNAYKALSESHNALKTENDTFKAEKAAAERKNHIISKANELGIPQYRIDEGFVIPDNASDEAIADYLGKVANNIKAQQLPDGGNKYPFSGNAPDKTEIDSIVATLIP